MTKKLVRVYDYLFGNPADNVTYLPLLIQELRNGGCHFEVLCKTKDSPVKRIEKVVLFEYIDLMKADGVKLLKQDNIDFMKEWLDNNQDLPSKAGLGNGPASEGSKFVSGIFFSWSCATVRATPSVCLSS
jgi:hypothetical protein